MIRIRKPKKTDQETVRRALQLLLDFAHEHPEIEISLWYSAFISAFVHGHIQTGYTHQKFLEVLNDVGETYKDWFEIKE